MYAHPYWILRSEGQGNPCHIAMSKTALEHLRELLEEHSVTPKEIQHAPTYTSEQSAAARGEELRVGGKALLMKVGKVFSVFVLPANRRIDSTKIRQQLGSKKMRFASADELLELTGLVPGSVPPFGRPILPFDLYLDDAINENDRIAFNAGSLTDSMILPMGDYLRVANPTDVFSFSIKEEE